MSFKKVVGLWALAASAVMPSISHAAEDWISGNVILIEDMRALSTWSNFQILVNLGNRTYPANTAGAAIQAACTQPRLRIVQGQEGVTLDLQKSFLTIMLAARLSGDRVRVLVNSDNALDGFCAVKAVAVGEV